MELQTIESLGYGIIINKFDVIHASTDDVKTIKEAVYQNKMVVLKNQQLTPQEFVSFGEQFGELREYYEKMYHHHERKEIFVSSNVEHNGMNEGVPKTGSFWHSDYAFMQKPFALTMTYPKIVPSGKRGTYFIDMAHVYKNLDDGYKQLIDKAESEHSVRKYFKIRPKDVYRPISEILNEIEEVTPTVAHPTVVTHPVTGEKILYLNEGFTFSIKGVDDKTDASHLLKTLLEFSGQLDESCTHPNIRLLEMEENDIIIWDNRRLVHRAKHTANIAPTKTYRLTIYDDLPFSAI